MSVTDRFDAARYRWLKSKLSIELGGYVGPDYLANADCSAWYVRSGSIFKVEGNKPPSNFDEAIDKAMKEEDVKNA